MSRKLPKQIDSKQSTLTSFFSRNTATTNTAIKAVPISPPIELINKEVDNDN